MKETTVSVIGLGFVGLSIAVTNAIKGIKTIGVDINEQKINNLKKCKIDFFEPGLDKKLKKSISSKNILFTQNIHDAIINSDITFLSVGTPPKKSGDVDLKFINNALKQIFRSLQNKKKYHLLVIKSTLPPSTTKKNILPRFQKLIKNRKMDIVVNPEFLREGFAIQDILKPHLIVIGADNKTGDKILEKYYEKFYSRMPEIIHTDLTSAELIKYANNAFLATKISFINSIANICQKLPESDVNEIAYAIGKDTRIGPLFLKAGPGFGGSCLPKDLSGLISFSRKINESEKFFEAVKNVNSEQPKKIIQIMKKMNVLEKNNSIAILGLAFKKDTDDVREAVSIKVVDNLVKRGLKVKVHDPMAMKNFEKIFGDRIIYCKSISSCLEKTNCCVLFTEWEQYKKLNSNNFKGMKQKNIIDARRVLDINKFTKMNFEAIGLGK